MSGDRLTKLAQQARWVYDRAPSGSGIVLANRDVLALIEVAEAARSALELLAVGGYDRHHEGGFPVCENLAAALARLDSGAALLAASPTNGDCTNCDGKGHCTGWPHTTCPVCGGTGNEPRGGGAK